LRKEPALHQRSALLSDKRGLRLGLIGRDAQWVAETFDQRGIEKSKKGDCREYPGQTGEEKSLEEKNNLPGARSRGFGTWRGKEKRRLHGFPIEHRGK